MRKLSLLLALLVCWAWSASASYISLKTTVSAKVDKSVLQVLVSAVNKGDESAYDVQAEIRVGEKKFLAEKRQILEVNKTYKGYAGFKLDLKRPGQYPLIVVVHYADANQYPFSALTAQTFSYGAGAFSSEIFGRIKSATFWKNGEINLTLKNMGDSEIAASTYLVVPRELTVKKGSYELNIPAKSEKQVDFAIENFSALSGSSYQVFAISEFEKENINQTMITPGMIKIVESRGIFGVNYSIIIMILAVLLLLFVAAQFLGKK